MGLPQQHGDGVGWMPDRLAGCRLRGPIHLDGLRIQFMRVAVMTAPDGGQNSVTSTDQPQRRTIQTVAGRPMLESGLTGIFF
jgi:hypothetical protein